MIWDNTFQPNFLHEFQNWFNSFIAQQKEEFTIGDIQVSFFKKFKTMLDPYTMDELLESNHLILNCLNNDLIFKRSQYFKEKTFKITPTSEEVFKKILIPGHHFIPFYSPELMPFSCKLFWNGDFIPMNKYSLSIRQAHTNYILTPTVMDVLLSMNEAIVMKRKDNANITHLNDYINIDVYDMADFYNHYNFSVGDSIFITVLDWDAGKFSISYANKELFTNTKKTEKWIHEMDEALTEVIDDYPGMWNPTDQFAYAFFYAQENNKLKEALCSISEYLEHSQKIQLKSLLYHTFLWTKDETNLNEYIWNITQQRKASRPWGLFHSLSCILEDLDTKFRGPLMQAMLWSEFDKGHTVAQDLLPNVFPDLPQDIKDYPFINDSQRKFFPKYWRQHVKEEKKRYNPFKDKKWKEIRESFSEILIDFYRWKNEVFLKNANFRKPLVSWLQLHDLIEEIETFMIISCNKNKNESVLNTDFDVTINLYNMLKSQVMQDITSTISLKLLPTLDSESKPMLIEDDIIIVDFLDTPRKTNKATKRGKTTKKGRKTQGRKKTEEEKDQQ